MKNTVIINGHVYTLLIYKTEEAINRMKNSCGFGPGYCKCGCSQKTKQGNSFIVGHNTALRTGLNNPRWKGGRRLNGGGRGVVRVKSPGHPKQDSYGYVFEHILVAEAALGKYLPDKAVVHHIDGNPANNKPENLVVCQNQAYHILLEQRARAYKACGYANWRRCDYCKEYSPAEEMYVRPNGSGAHHPKCCREYQRNLKARKGL